MRNLLLLSVFIIGILLSFFDKSYAISMKDEDDLQEQCGKMAALLCNGSCNDPQSPFSDKDHYNKNLKTCFMYLNQNLGNIHMEFLVDVTENNVSGSIAIFNDGQVQCILTNGLCNNRNDWDVFVNDMMTN